MFNKLVSLSQNGDKKAKEEIISRLQPLIISSINRYYYKKEEFEDLVQDGNIRVLECIEEYKPSKGVNFLGYVKTMLRYMYLDKHKRKVHFSLNEKIGDGDLEKVDLLVSDGKDILESILDEEEVRNLNKSLGDLTKRQREVIILFYMEDLSIGDIACKLGVSYRTVVNTKTAVLKKLEERLKHG